MGVPCGRCWPDMRAAGVARRAARDGVHAATARSCRTRQGWPQAITLLIAGIDQRDMNLSALRGTWFALSIA